MFMRAIGCIVGLAMLRNLVVALFLAACMAAPAPESAAEEVSIQGAEGALGGAYLAGDGAGRPAVLLHPGSGPTDRDGNQRNLRSDNIRLVAEAIAAAGYPTLRVDKRGVGASAAPPLREENISLELYAQDVRRWIDWLTQEQGAPCVILLGHSEGGMIAMLAAAEDERVCGLVLAATLGRPAADVIADQLRAGLQPSLLDQALEINAALARGERVDNVPSALSALFRPSVQPFLIGFYRLNPPEVLTRSSAPALVLQGDNDLQITVADAQALAAARAGVELRVIEGMSHMLRQAPRDRAGNIASYNDHATPIDAEAIAAILAFLARVHASQ